MTLLISDQMPPPPVDAWGAFFEHFDNEIAAGRETQESVRRIHERACNLDWEARFRDTEESSTVEPIKMNPCPFCEGPPCVMARDETSGVIVYESHKRDPDAEEKEYFEAHVWCHDCGAQGPRIDTATLCIFEGLIDLEVADVMRIAVERWNDRHNKARNCYDAGEAEGLNIWPRGAA